MNIFVLYSLLLCIICTWLASLQKKTKIYKTNGYDYTACLVRNLYDGHPCLTYRLNKIIFVGNK